VKGRVLRGTPGKSQGRRGNRDRDKRSNAKKESGGNKSALPAQRELIGATDRLLPNQRTGRRGASVRKDHHEKTVPGGSRTPGTEDSIHLTARNGQKRTSVKGVIHSRRKEFWKSQMSAVDGGLMGLENQENRTPSANRKHWV